MDLWHVASPQHIDVGDVLAAEPQSGLHGYQQEILEGLFPPDGAVTSWGRAMLAEERMLLGDDAWLATPLASVPSAVHVTPGHPGDQTLHITAEGRKIMRTTRDRVSFSAAPGRKRAYNTGCTRDQLTASVGSRCGGGKSGAGAARRARSGPR